MTRIKEPEIGSNQIPDYKSPPERIVRSLRKGYDNIREKVSKKSKKIMALQGKLRDVEKSRENWKERAEAAEKEIASLKKINENLQENVKKRT